MLRIRPRIHDESGVALVFALLAVVILGGLGTLFVSRAVAQSRATGSEQRFEAAIHIAEAGLDDLIYEMNTNFDLVTETPGGADHLFDPGTHGADAAAEEAWAVNIAQDDTACAVVTTAVGEACAIRPRIDDGSSAPADFIFSVGFVPSRAEADKVRVVKVQIAPADFIPAKAILTQGAINPFNIEICGQDRDVHSNGDLLVKGNADTVSTAADMGSCTEEGSGDVTSKGTFTEEGNPDIGPGSGQTGQQLFVPSVSAAEVYEDYLHPTGKNYDGGTWHNDWNTLCPDGTVRGPYFGVGYNPETDTPDPCNTSAPQLYPPTSGPVQSNHKGWRYVTGGSDCNTIGGAPCWRAGSGGNNAPPMSDGVFYVYHRNALMEGNVGVDVNITVLVDSIGTIVPFERYTSTSAAPPGDTCKSTNASKDGSIGLFGIKTGDVGPFLKKQLLLADRDIKVGGNIETDIHGILAAHEQVELAGEPYIVGAVITEDACPHSVSSPVSANSFSGNVVLPHNGDNVGTLPSNVHITAWNEY